MRLVLACLIATVGAAPVALAQTPAPQTTPMTPAPQTTPMTPAPQTTPMTPTPQAAAPTAETPPPTPPPPPPPPPPPTDPTAIDLLDSLQGVCIPSVEGGNLDRLAKAHGYHRSGDNYVLHGRGFQFTLLAPGSNPNQCHIDIIHPVDPQAPAAPLVVALHNWAAVERDWSLYRNDKNVEGNQELTTRSWEHDDPGKHEAMFITTYRHADGSPMKGSADTSTLVYSETKTST